ncbi:MAG TPA: spore cortex-lytic enzyme, pre-pro-form [Ruminococcus sp.]|nr:spore cortex-lytic enzyme, pre-pro-form [Ruminococcus sp.]
MPYTPEQKKKHVRELQRYLQGIAYYNHKIPLIIPDGYFGKETSTAVRAFQREYKLDETGSVNHETWNKIASVHRDFVDSEPFVLDVFPSQNYLLSRGDSGFLVYIIQVILFEMSLKYDEFPAVSVNGIFDNQTYDAVSAFQKTAGLVPNGTVNNNTWNILSASVKHLI